MWYYWFIQNMVQKSCIQEITSILACADGSTTTIFLLTNTLGNNLLTEDAPPWNTLITVDLPNRGTSYSPRTRPTAENPPCCGPPTVDHPTHCGPAPEILKVDFFCAITILLLKICAKNGEEFFFKHDHKVGNNLRKA